jgi:hypothetical protein
MITGRARRESRVSQRKIPRARNDLGQLELERQRSPRHRLAHAIHSHKETWCTAVDRDSKECHRQNYTLALLPPWHRFR